MWKAQSILSWHPHMHKNVDQDGATFCPFHSQQLVLWEREACMPSAGHAPIPLRTVDVEYLCKLCVNIKK